MTSRPIEIPSNLKDWESWITRVVSNDDPLPLSLNNPDQRIIDAIVDLIEETTHYRVVQIFCNLATKPGDIAGCLSNIKKQSLVVFQGAKSLSPTCLDYVISACNNHCMTVILGEGPTAPTLKIEFMPFASILVFNGQEFVEPIQSQDEIPEASNDKTSHLEIAGNRQTIESHRNGEQPKTKPSRQTSFLVANPLFPTPGPPSVSESLARTTSITKLLKSDPNNDALLYELGALKLRGSPPDPQQAANLAKRALEINPNQMDYYCLLIASSFEAEDYSTAIDMYSAMITLASKDPETHYRNINFEVTNCLTCSIMASPEKIVTSLENSLNKGLIREGFDERNYAIEYLIDALETTWKPADYDGEPLAPLNEDQITLAQQAMNLIVRLNPSGETKERAIQIAEIIDQC